MCFLLDMGESVKIVDLARQMIRLSGFRPIDEHGVGDIEIQFTGLRPGEKLYEELLIDVNKVEKTEHERILKSFEKYIDYTKSKKIFINLNSACLTFDNFVLEIILSKYVDGYHKDIF